DRIRTQTACHERRIEEGVNRRQAVIDDIDHRDSNQLVTIVKTGKVGGFPFASQEGVELLADGWVHVAIALPAFDVSGIHGVYIIALYLNAFLIAHVLYVL